MRIMIHWPELGASVKATLAYPENPELCQEIWDALPMESIINHASSSGAGMFTWLPLVSHAKVDTYENIKNAPVGRLRYLFNTGNKISIQYGVCAEDKLAPKLGLVDEADIEKLPAIGNAVWNAMMLSKEPIHIRFSKLNAQDAPEEFKPACRYLTPPTGASEEAVNLAKQMQEAAFVNFAKENPGLKRIRTGGNRASGAGGQYFTSWDTAAGVLRDYSFALYEYTVITRSNLFNRAQLAYLFPAMFSLSIGILINNGLDEHAVFVQKVKLLLQKEISTLSDIITVTDALCMYAQSLESWMWFYFPWGLGTAFRFPEV